MVCARRTLVLDVAKRLGALIEERMGSEVIFTRSDDTFIPLERRTEIANEAKADLFLSIHANSSTLAHRGRRGDLLSELHHFSKRAGSGRARKLGIAEDRLRTAGSAGKDRAQGQSGGIARVCQPGSVGAVHRFRQKRTLTPRIGAFGRRLLWF